MSDVIFASISDFDRQPTAFVKKAISSGKNIVITKRGRPAVLMRKVSAKDKGRVESISKLINKINEVVSSIEKNNSQVIVTRNDLPAVVLKRITDKAFRIKE